MKTNNRLNIINFILATIMIVFIILLLKYQKDDAVRSCVEGGNSVTFCETNL